MPAAAAPRTGRRLAIWTAVAVVLFGCLGLVDALSAQPLWSLDPWGLRLALPGAIGIVLAGCGLLAAGPFPRIAAGWGVAMALASGWMAARAVHADAAVILVLLGLALFVGAGPGVVRRRRARRLAGAAAILAVLDVCAALIFADALFDASPAWRMPAAAAAALAALSASLFFHAFAPAGASASTAAADRRIAARIAVILSVVSLAALVTATVLMQQQLAGSFAQTMQASLQARGQLYDVYLRNHSAAGAAVASDPSLVATLRAGETGSQREQSVNAALRRLLPQGYSGLSVTMSDGGASITIGRFAVAPEFEARLATPEQAVLLWKEGEPLLRSRHAIQDSQGTLGVLLAERPLPVLRKLLLAADGLGEGGLAFVCVRQAQHLVCLPGHNRPAVASFALRGPDQRPSALARAAAGEHGWAMERDERGRTSLVAYGALTDLGLAMSVRHPSAEAFAPIRRHLAILLPLLVILVGLGVALARFQVTPLVLRLMRSERDATLANEALAARGDALHFAEKRLRAITDNVGALIGYVDGDERYRFVNEYYRQLFKRAPSELTGKLVREVVGDATYFHAKPYIDRALGGEKVTYENRMEDRYFLLTYTPDADDDGTVRGFYAMSIDITHRKRIEQALAESEERLRMITDNTPALIAYIDHEERYRFLNRQYAIATGRPLQELLGMRLADLAGERLYAAGRPYLDQVFAGKPVTFEAERERDGKVENLLITCVPDIGADGSVRGFYSHNMDITDRKRAEQAIATNERKLRTITDNLPVLIGYIDRDRRFRFNNRTYEEWLGRPLSEITGRLLAEVYPPEVWRLIEPSLDRAFAGERLEYEFEVPVPGNERHIKGVYVPELDAQGEVTGVYGLTYDVTAAKTVERRLALLAQFDSLTGLANRRHFNATLDDAIERHRGKGMRMALLFIDIDHFKSINDTRGHGEGDEVLKEFGRRLRDAVRSNDTVARLAGDEFVIVLEDLHNEREARLVAGKILSALETPFDLASGPLRVTASIGIASRGGVELGGSELLRRADAALYKAKEAGRNCYRIAA
jgi:diguanylate cyclase (GGDEF)-like protein/PAS domain S-box-containing protein